MSMLEILFEKNGSKIKELSTKVSTIEGQSSVSGLTYSFVVCTLSEAQAFGTTSTEYRHISDARKSSEGVGFGTGLPAFYDVSSGVWVDMSGSPITI